ncbi:hypothetical protein IMSHALPRED_002841 [Imshaugia aleurites]|uniref:Uncharacterized protein n=1 Tax=Imshaugia aleurites TaxID=172621 RepID=A0A8H3PJE0_9LECA|nr:hypothetical protein IMSHALPRED_002841 [Imshaugia aleurites]
MTRSFFHLSVLLPLLVTGVLAKAVNESSLNIASSLTIGTIGTTTCINPPSARESYIERVDYRDCIPLLNEILLDPNINHRNEYNATNAYQERIHGTCSIALLSRFADGTDVFWGYQIAIAAATAVKTCVEDSVYQYGGLVFTTSRLVFYAQVKNLEEGVIVEAESNATFLGTVPPEEVLLPANDTNAAPLRTATPICQISEPPEQHLYPIMALDCYYLFYNILTSPTVERPVILRGLYPIRYERYGTCTLQLHGHSAKSIDKTKYVELLLAAVNVVQTCVVRSGLVLGGAVSVGSRGKYSVRVYNSLVEAIGDADQSE